METVSLNSSAIASVTYEAKTGLMWIRFTSGPQEYAFCGVPENVFRGLVTAPSAGSYYDRHIRDRYQC